MSVLASVWKEMRDGSPKRGGCPKCGHTGTRALHDVGVISMPDELSEGR